MASFASDLPEPGCAPRSPRVLRGWCARTAVALLCVALAACHGGDSSSDAGAPPVAGTTSAPTITQQPANANTMPGQPATFSVVASGSAPLSYQWQRNGVGIAGATAASYTLATTAIGDNGATFRVVVGNAAGTATSASALLSVSMVTPTLTISLQPVGTSVVAGATASFTVGGTCSNGTLTIQWQRLGSGGFADIAGATGATYSFTAATTDNGAQFRANLACSGLSAQASTVATLTVAMPSALTLGAIPVAGTRSQANIGLARGIDQLPNGTWAFVANNTIRILSADLSMVTLLAGGDRLGSNDGPGATASFNGPTGITHDPQGNLYVADTTNDTIRRIAPDGTVSTLAGTAGNSGYVDGVGPAAAFNGPVGIVYAPDGNLYVGDPALRVIRKVTTLGVVSTYAGSGMPGTADGNAGLAQFSGPSYLVANANSDLYVADNDRIRAIVHGSTVAGSVTTLAGGGSNANPPPDGFGAAAGIDGPAGLLLRGTTLYVREFSGLLRMIDTTTAAVTTFSGSRTLGAGFSDGPPGAAQFDALGVGIANGPNGGFLVTDPGSIRTVSPAGLVTTIAEVPTGAADPAGTGVLAQLPFGFNALGSTAIVVDGTGRIDVGDVGDRTIRRIDTTGAVSLVAGLAYPQGNSIADGVGSAAKFRNPGNALAIATDGTLYVTDLYGVRRIAADGTTSFVAGSQTDFGAVDGSATTARFGRSLNGIAVGPTGDVFVSDTANFAIRRIDAAGNVTTFAGALGQSGGSGTTRLTARFSNLGPISFAPDGTLYLVNNGALEKIAVDGTVSVLVSNVGQIIDVVVDSTGVVYYTYNDTSSNPSGRQVLAIYTPATGAQTPILSTGPQVVLGNVAPSFGPYIGSMYPVAPHQLAVLSQNRLLLLTLP